MQNLPTPIPYDDYIQSANVLFHFMEKEEYLESSLKTRSLVPRYCIEDVKYLNLRLGETQITEIAVLQKCFCDIPLHKLTDSFELSISPNQKDSVSKAEIDELCKSNTHPDFYGKYAIALSKRWGEQNQLQPIQYINMDSPLANDFSKVFADAMSMDELPDSYSNDILNRLSFMKPLRGEMLRSYQKENEKVPKSILFFKNFHDEKEWRFVPSSEVLSAVKLERINANPSFKPLKDEVNKRLETEQYQRLWLGYNFDDIRYIIVPDSQARINVIKIIEAIPDGMFNDPEQVHLEKCVLISKIQVLDDIRKDW